MNYFPQNIYLDFIRKLQSLLQIKLSVFAITIRKAIKLKLQIQEKKIRKQSMSRIIQPAKIMKPVAKVQQKRIDDMILQLRQLISQSSGQKSIPIRRLGLSEPQRQQKRTTINIQSLIEESSRLIEARKNLTEKKPQVRGKIMAASQLLRDQKELIKSYVKEKIESQLFGSAQFYPSEADDYPLSRLAQEKQLLIQEKRVKNQRQSQRRRQLISQVRQFDTNSRVSVDVQEIDSLIYKEQPQSSYLVGLLRSDSKKITSKSNQVRNSNLYISEVYNQHESEMLQLKSMKQLENKGRMKEDEGNQGFTEVVEEQETYHNFEDSMADPKTAGLRNVLNKYPHLVVILGEFLKNQYAISYIKDLSLSLTGNSLEKIKQQKDQLQTNSKQPQGHIWRSQKMKPPSSKQQRRQKQTISTITKNFKFKGFSLNQQNKVQPQRQKLTQRRVSKMIGQSSKFHPKKCILTKSQLIYYQQKENSPQTFEIFIPEATKFIELQLQRVVKDEFKKEEGSFFSKKEISTAVVTVKGKSRCFKFESQVLEGVQLANDLKRLMTSKVYALFCKANGTNNLPLYHFIHDSQSPTLDITRQFIIPLQNFTVKQNRQLYLNIITDLFADRKQLQQLNLQRSKLQSSQISNFLKESRKLKQLKRIDLSHLRLTKQNFMELCQMVNEVGTVTEVRLSSCRLDDDCFLSNVGVFTSLCSKVHSLDISGNLISSKTATILKNSLQNITSQVKHLNISDCPIRDLLKINSLIKQSRKLQTIECANCGLYFNEKRFEELERFFDFLKSASSGLKKVNLSRNGALTQKEYAMVENSWQLQTLKQLVIDLDVGVVRQKGGKQLLRTDNSAINRNVVSIQLYQSSRKSLLV